MRVACGGPPGRVKETHRQARRSVDKNTISFPVSPNRLNLYAPRRTTALTSTWCLEDPRVTREQREIYSTLGALSTISLNAHNKNKLIRTGLRRRLNTGPPRFHMLHNAPSADGLRLPHAARRCVNLKRTLDKHNLVDAQLIVELVDARVLLGKFDGGVGGEIVLGIR